MATIGTDCEIILDSHGFFVVPGGYIVKQPRVRKMSYRADGTLSYVDLGPGRREWNITILARNELLKYDGTATGVTGQQYRDYLRSSYTSNIGATINFVDLTNTTIAVYFDSYEEAVLDLKSQIIALATGGSLAASYECKIALVEA